MKIKEGSYDEFMLSSGREVYAHNFIIGIAPNFEISYGYDGSIDTEGFYTGNGDEREGQWTAEEKRELADYMIRLWTTYRDRIA